MYEKTSFCNVLPIHDLIVCPSAVSEQQGNHSANFQPLRDIFIAFSLTESLTIDAMVAYAVGNRAIRTGDLQMRKLALRYRGNMMRQINERLWKEGTKPSPILLMSVCGLINALLKTSESSCLRDHRAIDIHVVGLRTLICNFGGWRTITEECFELTLMIIWQVSIIP